MPSQTSLPLLGRNGRNIPTALLLESKELARAVRAILDMDCKLSFFFFFLHFFDNLLNKAEEKTQF